jgi:hypothetical protein
MAPFVFIKCALRDLFKGLRLFVYLLSRKYVSLICWNVIGADEEHMLTAFNTLRNNVAQKL